MIAKLLYPSILFLICLPAVFLCACSNNISKFSFVNYDKSDEAFLEIKQNATGMVFPRGEKLVMRLYKSGRFEYDANPTANTSTDSKGNVLFERKQGQINKDDVNQLLSLVEQPDFLATKDFYPTIHPHTDDKWTTIINYTRNGRTKKIVIDDFWDINHYPEDKSKYPISLVELLHKQQSLKAKAVNEL